jgi:hypothetical protein
MGTVEITGYVVKRADGSYVGSPLGTFTTNKNLAAMWRLTERQLAETAARSYVGAVCGVASDGTAWGFTVVEFGGGK